ncbi:nucleotide exchange factor GrpE, partial [Buchnera aphidicola]|uniref:nucleotide exchange factor GrpE n=1 Tax=Buchnera aphidicola TaxID=9 RepID=UPI0021CA300A
EHNEHNELIHILRKHLKTSKEEIIKQKIKSEKEIIACYERLNKDIEKFRKFSLERILKDFLPIIDNIERALDLIEKSQSKEHFLEVINKLQFINDILKKCFMIFNIKKIDNVNVLFDPSIHQAMSVDYTEEIESNKIIKVMQPGYILHDSRLLRPAMVIVSKKKI